MIDEHSRTTEALVALRSAINEQRNDIGDFLKKFNDDFEIDIKEHINNQGKELIALLNEIRKAQETEEEKRKRIEHYNHSSVFFKRLNNKKRNIGIISAVISGIMFFIGGSISIYKELDAIKKQKIEINKLLESNSKQNPPIDNKKNPK